MGLYGVCAAAVCGAFLVILLRQYNPVYAFAVSLLLSVFVLYRIFALCGQYAEKFRSVLTLVPEVSFEPFVKVTGVAVLVQTAADLCREAGQPALESKLTLLGRVVITCSALPLICAIFQMITTKLL